MGTIEGSLPLWDPIPTFVGINHDGRYVEEEEALRLSQREKRYGEIAGVR